MLRASFRRLATLAADVHPTAIVHPDAVLEAGVRVGPFCVVGAGARLRAGAELIASVHVGGYTEIGRGTRVYPFACLGLAPQDKKHVLGGEPTRLEIGANCEIREHVTAHTGTAAGGGLTRIGDGCLLMASVHVAHDCTLGAGAILANATLLAGHVRVGERAVIGGHSALHQHVTIGRGAFVGGGSVVAQDVGPFSLARGNRARLQGINLVGLRRSEISREEIKSLVLAFRKLFGGFGTYFAPRLLRPSGHSRPLSELAAELIVAAETRPLALELARFVLDPTRRRPMCAAAETSNRRSSDADTD
ncbi:trimeric LpxA-like protein [Pavlovales sp. CCMP2436]|nr:trimeric LpxA-like protein [Pavlovales sp. CCMP2436]